MRAAESDRERERTEMLEGRQWSIVARGSRGTMVGINIGCRKYLRPMMMMMMMLMVHTEERETSENEAGPGRFSEH